MATVLAVNVWTSRLIGRDRELAALGSLLDEAGADGTTLLLTGVPGVGTTDWLAAAAEMAATAGFEVIRGGGVEYETDVSFAGLHQLVGPMSRDLRRLPRSSRVWRCGPHRWRCSARRHRAARCSLSSTTCTGWTAPAAPPSGSSAAGCGAA